MRKFVKSSLSFIIFLLFPALILASLYIYFDPFKVIKHYSINSYAAAYSRIEPNRDYISTEIFLRNRGIYNYNSFIFGSSRAISFNPESWIQHLDNNAVPFAFDAAGEGIFGIYTKLKFLENEQADLNNVLILFCRGGLKQYKNDDNHLSIKHPKVSGESWIKFHFVMFKAYFSLRFLLGYYSFIITGKENPLTHGIIQDKGVYIDSCTNHIIQYRWEEELIKDPEKYYESRKDLFYEREGEMFESEQEIEGHSLKMLIEIRDILERNHSNFKIILNPIYDQMKFSGYDKNILKELFGDHLYDFTGKNFITENDTNWYEIYHFRPFVGDSIMNIIYSPGNIADQWR